nr:CoA-transferase [Pyramidobacter sp. CG50-2]
MQTENGCLGVGPKPEKKDYHFIGAVRRFITPLFGCSFFVSEMSFGLLLGGHVDATVLGTLETDQEGSLANWIIPGKLLPGMGGAMNLVVGAKRVIVATTHCNKKAIPRSSKSVAYP